MHAVVTLFVTGNQSAVSSDPTKVEQHSSSHPITDDDIIQEEIRECQKQQLHTLMLCSHDKEVVDAIT